MGEGESFRKGKGGEVSFGEISVGVWECECGGVAEGQKKGEGEEERAGTRENEQGV